METFRSEAGVGFEMVGGGPATPTEVAAVAAALDVVLGGLSEPPVVNRWRWSGRPFTQRANWRGARRSAHPSRP